VQGIRLGLGRRQPRRLRVGRRGGWGVGSSRGSEECVCRGGRGRREGKVGADRFLKGWMGPQRKGGVRRGLAWKAGVIRARGGPYRPDGPCEADQARQPARAVATKQATPTTLLRSDDRRVRGPVLLSVLAVGFAPLATPSMGSKPVRFAARTRVVTTAPTQTLRVRLATGVIGEGTASWFPRKE